MLTIPKIFHQTWKTAPLPSPFSVLADTWKSLHPDWEYTLWTDEMNRALIRDHYPWFLEKYDSYPRNIQRVDAFRYFLLHKEGGVYIDADFECLENIDELLENATCVIGKEPMLHCERFGRDMILCNAFMAATPGHDFMATVCKELLNYPCKEDITPKEILKSTGPFILTDTHKKYTDKNAIKLLDANHLYPLTMFETRDVFKDTMTDDMQRRVDNAHALHYFWGGWK